MGNMIYYVQSVRSPEGWIVTERRSEYGAPYHYREVATVKTLRDAHDVCHAMNERAELVKGLIR